MHILLKSKLRPLCKKTLHFGSSVMLCVVLALPLCSSGQRIDTLINRLDSLANKQDSVLQNERTVIPQQVSSTDSTPVFPHYFALLASDLKQQVTFPFHATKNQWLQVGELGLATAALSFADKPVSRFAVNLRENNKAVSTISSTVTKFGGPYEIYTLAGLVSYGMVFKNKKLVNTTLLASQAFITAGLIQSSLKFLTGRQRPNYQDPFTKQSASTFHGPFYQFTKDRAGKQRESAAYTSFPSGHTTAAFAAATVFAVEYRDQPHISALSYSIATLIGFSRMTEKKHWPTDVLIGAAIGFFSGRQVVSNYHRLARIKGKSRLKKQPLTFRLNYYYDTWQPSVVYSF